MKKLIVGLVIDTSIDRNDGVQQYVKTLGAWLKKRGHEVYYLTGKSDNKHYQGSPIVSLSKSLEVKFNANHLNMPLPASKAGIQKVLREVPFDVLHIQMPYAPWLAGRLVKACSHKTAVVGTFHIMPAGRLHAESSRLLAAVIKRIDRRYDAIMSVSQPAAEFAKRIFGYDTVVIPNAVELKRFKTTSNISKIQQGHIVFLGRLVERKGVLQLLKAFKWLQQTHPNTRLTIAGTGPLLPALERYVIDNHLSGAVIFAGYVSEHDKPLLLASAQIACFPALYGESFGIVLIEAMAAGSEVVIGGDNPGYRSVLGEHPELLFDPKNYRQLATKLESFLVDGKRRAVAQQWQQNHVTRYDIEVVGQEIEQQYYTAIAKRQKNSHT